MANLGGEFNLGFRYGALEGAAGADNSVEHRHFPAARHQPTGWSEDGAGGWISSGSDQHHWEVYCAECGDLDGPIERQSPAVQHLRGPYRSEHHAKSVATRHFEEN